MTCQKDPANTVHSLSHPLCFLIIYLLSCHACFVIIIVLYLCLVEAISLLNHLDKSHLGLLSFVMSFYLVNLR
jgi:hypothetical protein